MNQKMIFAAIAATAIGAQAYAQETGDIGVGFGLSTFGANLEASYQVSPEVRLRGAFMGGIDETFEEVDPSGVSARGNVKLGGFAALVDYYPSGRGAFRFSGGLFVSDTNVSGSGEVELSTGAEKVTVNAEFVNEISPMVTAGYDYGFGNGWGLSFEGGVVYTDGIKIDVTATNPSAQDRINDDREVQDLISDAKDIVVYPYISIGVTYRY